jgi:hypothetical protein
MDEPEDPGGTVPQASNIVTIEYNCSGMDTEGSVRDTDGSESKNNTHKRKRTSSRKICKTCNKKKRRHQKSSSILPINELDCHCLHDNSDHTPNNSITPSPTLHDSPTNEIIRTSISRSSYQASDAAPYIIHVQKDQIQPNDNVSIHPVSLGHFLKRHNFKNIINGSLKKIGRNRITISFSNFEDANSFLNNNVLKTNNYKVFIPSFNVTRMGVVRGIPVNWSENDIIDNITVPLGCGHILKVRRLKKKIFVDGKPEFSSIETVVLTFDGQILPKRVFMCYNSLPVDLYIFPTIQCFNCCKYGHIKSQCRSSPKCFKCGQGHTGDSCSVDEDYTYCCLCSGSHYATSRKCPEFSRQKSIKESMAKNCISYIEAVKLHPPITKLYADVVSSNISSPSLHPTLNSQSDIPNINVHKSSYKKTVFRKPSIPQNPHSKDYNRSAHAELIKDHNIPLPSIGGGYSVDNNISNVSIKELILILINTLSKYNISIPTNDAVSDETITKVSTHNGQLCSSSVEL